MNISILADRREGEKMQGNHWVQVVRNPSRMCFFAALLLFVLVAADVAAATVPGLSMSAGCNKAAALTAGTSTFSTTDGNKIPRTFLVKLPNNYNSARTYALTFVFHGAGGSSKQSYAWGLQDAVGASDNSIFVYPQALQFLSFGIGWDDTNRGYDLPFFDNMVNIMETKYCIDTGQVFAAGFSWGGDFVTSLACNRGDTVRGIAVNSATDEFTDNKRYLTYLNLPCPSRLRPAVRFVHATVADSAYPAPDFATTSSLFRYLEKCTGAGKSIASSTKVMSCVAYAGCTQSTVECNFDPSIGHALPPNWAQDTWDFFSSLPPPA